MYAISKLLGTCGLALFICTNLIGQAEDKFYQLSRWHITPGQEQVVIDVFAKTSDIFKDNTELEWGFYLNHDHSLEVWQPMKDMAAIDRAEAAMNHAMASNAELRASDEERAAMEKLITKSERMILKYSGDKSYVPIGNSYSYAPYYENKVFRIKPGKYQEMMEHAKAHLPILHAMNSRVETEFYLYEYGGERDMYMISFPGHSAADLAERMAAHQASLTKEAKAWETKLKTLVDEAYTNTSTLVEEISAVPTAAPGSKPSNLFAVSMEHFVPGKEAEYAAIYGKMKDALRKGETDFEWQSDVLEDGRLYNFLPIDNMSDIDVINEQIRKRRYQLDQEEMAGLYQRLNFANTASSTEMVVRFHPELSYLLPMMTDPTSFVHFQQTEYEFAPKDRGVVMQMAKEIKALYEKNVGAAPWQVFSYEFGGPGNVLVVRSYAPSKEALTSLREQDRELAASTEYKAWDAKRTKYLTVMKQTYGREAPEFGYEVRTKK